MSELKLKMVYRTLNASEVVRNNKLSLTIKTSDGVTNVLYAIRINIVLSLLLILSHDTELNRQA